MRSHRRLSLLLAVVLLSQLIGIFLMPYADTSEPRYAEIARLMASTNDWITPWFEPDVPFWGKPPLSFWMQALFIKIFGVAEFSARLPAWLANLAVTYLVAIGAKSFYQKQSKSQPQIGLIAALIYSSCTLSYITASAVLTDPYLNLGATLAFVSILAFSPTKPLWGYAFFIGLSIGALAKGPLIFVFVAIPLVFGCLLKEVSIRKTLGALPWFSGLLLFCVLTMPWYVLAELKTPGFLHYFIIGEHIQRFIDPGWQGDLYGTAHQKPWGTIWWLWLQATFPWGLVGLISWIYLAYKKSKPHHLQLNGLTIYLISAMLLSPLFFTFSGNILWTYNLPSIAPFAIFIAPIIFLVTTTTKARIVANAFFMLVPLLCAALVIFTLCNPNKLNTEKNLVQKYIQDATTYDTLYYLDKLPFSARYYSQGQAQRRSMAELKNPKNRPLYVAVPRDQIELISKAPFNSYETIFENKRYFLLKITFTG